MSPLPLGILAGSAGGLLPLNDFSFNIGSGFNSPNVETLAIQSDGKIIVGGSFTSYNGTTVNRIARLNANGSLDTSFATGSGFSSTVRALKIQSDGKIVVGGSFTSYNGTTTNRIVRLNANGSRDTSFAIGTGFSSIVYALAIQSDGKIIVGGSFGGFSSKYNGTRVDRIARLNSNGSLDNTFGTGFSSTVRALAIQSDGKILAGGSFRTFNGTTANRIARLNSNGSLDTGFGNGFSNTVYAVAIQSDGKIVVGGYFLTFNDIRVDGIARLNSNGSLDTSLVIGTGFGSGFNRTVYALAIQSDGKIIVGGLFTVYNGTTATKIARLNSNGSLDTSFASTGFIGSVYSLALQSDSKIVAGGGFTSFDGTAVNYITRLHPVPTAA